MSEVFVSLGSNVDADRNIRAGIVAMQTGFGDLVLSPTYRSAAVGFVGDDFLNLVAGITTELTVQQVVAGLRAIEDELGRDRTQPRFSPRPIDLDILLYDDLVLDEPGVQVPRREILENAFVLKPLQDLVPEFKHPVDGQSYHDLWLLMGPTAPRLDVVEL